MSTTTQTQSMEAENPDRAFRLAGKSKWAGIVLLLGIFSTGMHVSMVKGMLPGEFTALLSNGLPDSSLLYAGVVLLTAAAVMLLLPHKPAAS